MRIREILGLFFLFWAVFLMIALLSYDPGDPSFNQAVSGKHEINNTGGLAGSYLAGLFVDLLGFSAFFIPIFSAYAALRIIVPNFIKALPRNQKIGILLFSLGLLIYSASESGEALLRIGYVNGGGYLGSGLHSILQSCLSGPGLFLLLVFIFLASFQLTTGISIIRQILPKIVQFFIWFGGILIVAARQLFDFIKKTFNKKKPSSRFRDDFSEDRPSDMFPSTSKNKKTNDFQGKINQYTKKANLIFKKLFKNKENQENAKWQRTTAYFEQEPSAKEKYTTPDLKRPAFDPDNFIFHEGESAEGFISAAPSGSKVLQVVYEFEEGLKPLVDFSNKDNSEPLADVEAQTIGQAPEEILQDNSKLKPSEDIEAIRASDLSENNDVKPDSCCEEIEDSTEKEAEVIESALEAEQEGGTPVQEQPDESDMQPNDSSEEKPQEEPEDLPEKTFLGKLDGVSLDEPFDGRLVEGRNFACSAEDRGESLAEEELPLESSAKFSDVQVFEPLESIENSSDFSQPSRELAPEDELPDDLKPDLGFENDSQAPISVESQSLERSLPCPALRESIALPPLNLLSPSPTAEDLATEEDLKLKAEALLSCFNDFGVQGELVRIIPGPVVTMFEYKPAPGIRVSRIAGLSDDLARALKALAVRIEAPIPGRDTVGVEIPNEHRQTVYLRDVLESDSFKKASSKLTLSIGKDIQGRPQVADLSKMPHLLVAGATGAGKSVCLNGILLSILYKARPDEVKLLLIDPKRIELSVYSSLPHLIHPVVTDMSLAKNALDWAVHDMDRRYERMATLGVRNIDGYNARLKQLGDNAPEGLEFMPYLVIIIDELADLMMTAAKEVELSIVRLAQLARAAGVHIILATQRPSVDVVTGLIKANFPTRISFQVTSKHDSRTILDGVGAEHLLGRGDMLLKPSGGKCVRMHGAFVSDDEATAVVDYWKGKAEQNFELDFAQWKSSSGAGDGVEDLGNDTTSDPLYAQALDFVMESGKASISLIQRRFRIGFNRAARFIEQMEREGLLAPPEGSKPRAVIRGKGSGQ